jgi:hypothetical protein
MFSIIACRLGEEKKQARKRIRAYIRDSMDHLILYLLMYLPYRYAFYPYYRIDNKNIMAN